MLGPDASSSGSGSIQAVGELARDVTVLERGLRAVAIFKGQLAGEQNLKANPACKALTTYILTLAYRTALARPLRTMVFLQRSGRTTYSF